MVFFIIFIKIVFVISAAGYLILTHTNRGQVLDSKLLFWKERTEFNFIASMSLLLIYHFRPKHNKPVSEETGLLFFLFGCILLLTAKWDIFIHEAPWFKFITSQLK